MYNKVLTPEQAWQKIRHFCAYQERGHYETREKLYSYRLNKTDVESLLSRLIEEDYLNETRFAAQYAGGHFRIKKWGKVKIVHELKQKRVSLYNIKSALKEIDDADYHQTLRQLAQSKWRSLKAEQYLNRMAKTTRYLTGKGYEPQLISEILQEIRAGNGDPS